MEQSATNALGTDTRAGAGRPPSFAQERMWFLDRLAGGHSTAYVSTPMWWVRGPLDRTRFERALARVAARHETLRSRFTDLDGVPRVLVDDHVGIPVQWREATDAAQVDREARAEADRPFDLSRGPLLRIVLWRLGDHEHVLLAAMHHIISDAWSAGLLVKELGALHDGAALPELPCTYTRFAAEQRQELEGEALHADLAFWRERLGGLPVLELPVDRARGVRPSWAGATCSFELDPELVAGLERLGREHGATLYMTLLAVFEVLIGGWCGQSDFGVGTPVAGRGRPEVEHLVGLFVNTLVVRADLSGDPAFTELLARVRDHTLDALDHQHVPYERVVRELRPGRPDTDSLIDAWFAMQNVPDTGDDTGTLHFSDFDTDRPRALFSLSLFAQPRRDGGMSMTFVYATDVFDAVSVGRLVARCRGVLAAVVASPGVRVSELGLPAGEVGVLRRWGAGEVSPGVVGDPVVLFEERVRRVPGAVAVWSGGRSVSYAELNARANRVAWWLRGRGVSAEVPVGVRVRRGVDMVAAVLGVLKAGGVYVPLDPDWPAERVEFVLGDVGASVVLEGELPDGGREDDPGVVVAAEQLAYVIFTSGSTGRPKGVGVSRGAFAVHVGRMRRRFALGAADRVLQFAALAFDASVEQIFPALSCGAALVLPGHGLIAPGTLLTELQDHRVTIANLPPAYFGELVDRLRDDGRAVPDALRLMILGGDAVRPDDVCRWSESAPEVPLINAYGPTEATVSSTVFEVPAGAGEWPGGVPLGRAVGPRSLHVLDEGLREVPAGAVGELFIGGSVLARGYVGRPGLTAQRFVPDPFGEVPGGRLYRTGDLVRWRNDGQLAFCGRADDQVKVRGFRVETGEVETRLREHPGVEDAAVVVWQDRLVAYLAGREAPAGERMRDWLGERLPAYMVPALFIAVEELPRTVGGKVDRGRLPDPDHHRPASQRTYEAPRTPAEQAVAEVWQEVLQLDEVGIHDNFFDLGGHSLLVTLAVARLVKALGRPVDVRDFFAHPTVAELAAALPAEAADPAPGIGRIPRSGDFPLSYAQEGLWFLHQLDPEAPDYMAALAWRVEGQLDRARLDDALRRLVQRQESLRTTFPLVDARPVQRVTARTDAACAWRDLTHLPDALDEAVRQAGEELREPFDLEKGPLFRALVWQLDATEHLLVLAMHHIVTDGWSMSVLVRELGALYAGEDLPELPVQYADYTDWQRNELGERAVTADLAFWRERLGGLPVLELPVDRARGVRPSWAGATCSFELDPELVAGLERLGREHGATLYMTLLAVFEVLIGGWCGQSDFGVGTPVAGRGRPEVEHLVGLFVNTLVVRADLSGDPAFTELLARVRDHTLEGLGHQNAPFDRVVEELRPDRDLGHSPLFRVMFDLEARSIAAPRLGSARLRPVDVPFDVTKYDLMFTFTTDPGSAGGFVQYRTDVFDAVSVGRLVARCRGVLAAVVASPGVRVSELGLPAGEVGVLRRWGAGEVSPGVVGDPVVLFEERVRRVPGAVAVWSGGRSVSYAELNARANRVAWWLRGRGVSAEVPVGVRVRRGVDMVAAVLGVLKAGGVYVPLDPDWPAERVAFVLGDVGASVVLEGELPDGGREDDPGVVVAAEQLAYVIFTSGSTGRPKGVGVSRGAFAVHVGRMRRRFALGAADRVLQFAALAFDASVEQIFPALSCGAALVLPGHGLIAPGTLLTELQDHRVTVMEVVPAYLSELVTELSAAGGPAEADLGPLRLLVLGGDVVRPADITWWHRRFPDTTVVNTYGPTEATVSSTVFELPAGAGEWPGGVPLGRAVGPRSLHVLDEGLREVPAGAVGELFIGGSVLARGYVGRPGLTAQRFVPDPFGEVPGGRLYRTGDLVRWRNDGQLAFCGRADDQVKVRGFRVETGEVETRLREHPGVEDAAVVVWQDRLVAYLAGREAPAGERMRDWLGERLPAYMVPALFIAVEELPRTVGGKIDRGRLPDPDHHRPASQRTYEAPRTPAEQAVAEVWQEVLQLDEVGIHDNFFDLGGHSLLATRAVMRLRAVFGVDVGVRALFERPSVAGLADAVEEQLVREITAMSAEDVEQALRERETADVVERAPGAQDRVEKEQQA